VHLPAMRFEPFGPQLSCSNRSRRAEAGKRTPRLALPMEARRGNKRVLRPRSNPSAFQARRVINYASAMVVTRRARFCSSMQARS
jgi:hypothetical protein